MKIPSEWPPTHAGDPYYPRGALDTEDDMDSLARWWYGTHLLTMQEPRLPPLADTGEVEAIRFLWIRSFHAPVAVRLEQRGRECSVVTTVLARTQEYAPGPVDRCDTLPLAAEAFRRVRDRISVDVFWAREEKEIGLDGAQWIFEWVRPGEYRVVDHWSPSARGRHAEAREVGVHLLEIGRVVVPLREIY